MMIDAAPPLAPSRKPRLRRLAPLLVIALASAVILLLRAGKLISLEELLRHREHLLDLVAAHYFASLGIYALIYALMAALCVPGAILLTLVGGFLFGGWLGGALAALAATTGATVLFLTARSSLGAMLSTKATPWLARFRAGFERDAASYMLFLRLVPVFPFWLVNLAAALIGVRPLTFLWTTFAGILPATFVFAFAGAGLDSIAKTQQDMMDACVALAHEACEPHFSLASLLTRQSSLALAGLALLSLLPILLRRWRGGTTIG